VDEIAADSVLVNGRIVTLDPACPRATALAIASDRIVAVGGDREILRLRARRTKVVELRRATVVPGLVDAHAHLDREGLNISIRRWRAAVPSPTSRPSSVGS